MRSKGACLLLELILRSSRWRSERDWSKGARFAISRIHARAQTSDEQRIGAMDTLFSRNPFINPRYAVGHLVYRVGRKLGSNRLTYNGLIFRHFDRIARIDAHSVINVMTGVY